MVAPLPPTIAGNGGLPVEVPPPLFVGFDEPAPKPDPPKPEAASAKTPPQSGVPAWLARLRLRLQAAASAAVPSDLPARHGPVAQLAGAAAPAAPSGRWAALTAGRWAPFYRWGRWVGVALVLVCILYAAGIPPFSHRFAFHRLSSAGPIGAAATPIPRDPAERLAYFRRYAQGGDPEAELQLAILYAKGLGVEQDFSTAATWFRAAAEQGLARAQYDLGVLYERGRGVSADATEAANWYLKGAEGGYPLAQYNLAVAYSKGQGTRKDLPEAALWYRRAAIQGVVQAMINLGMLYERGDGVAASPADAYAWYLAAGRRGNQAAAKRADDVFTGMTTLDQIRATALATDVAGSIHDAASETSGN
jgi:hypothetical protein